jgi:hypothetical protein
MGSHGRAPSGSVQPTTTNSSRFRHLTFTQNSKMSKSGKATQNVGDRQHIRPKGDCPNFSVVRQ